MDIITPEIVICTLYKVYLERRMLGIGDEEARYFGDADAVTLNYFSEPHTTQPSLKVGKELTEAILSLGNSGHLTHDRVEYVGSFTENIRITDRGINYAKVRC